MSVRRVRIPIPLNGKAAEQFSPSYIRKTLEKLDRISIFKPGRIFGAVWTDDKINTGKAVTMCGSCVHRYRGWWKKFHYKGDWGFNYVADCDGCGERNLNTTLFLNNAEFYNSLGRNHGLQPRR